METTNLPTEAELLQPRNSKGALAQGGLFLSLTREELVRARHRATSMGAMGLDPSVPEELVDITRIKLSRYSQLMDMKTRLENSTKALNPIERFANMRAVKSFQEAARSLYLETKTMSERMERQYNDMFLSCEGVVRVDIQPHDVVPSLEDLDIHVLEWDGTEDDMLLEENAPQYEVGLFDVATMATQSDGPE